MTVGFPQVVLGIKVEILLNGTWNDISQYVYQRDDIQITGGQADESSQTQPAQMTLTLNNTDGRFSPNNTNGAYYPYLQRNTQIRLSINTQSTTGNTYNGFRFWGEVPVWPPLSDQTGTDIYVQITANGPLRRLNQGGGVGSALTRYYNTLTGSQAPIAYWPCEEDPDTDVIGAGITGGTTMAITTGTPTWKANNSFNGSGPIGVLNNSTWDGLTGSFGASGDDVFIAPGTFPWIASTTTVNAKVWAAGGGGGWGSGAANGFAGAGGGEFAQEATLAVTPGNTYMVTVGAGGQGGSNNGISSAGGDSIFPGDSVTVHAHGGSRGANITPGAGGTGSTNTTHHDGGAGGTGQSGTLGGGGGGGSSAGTGANGNAGANGSGGTGGAGGTAPTGGAAGGAGGSNSILNNGNPGGVPGGGAGGADASGNTGGAGGSGKVELIYTPPAAPPVNVIRFIMEVPPHGGNNGKVLLRALTGGTVARIDCLYITGGKIQLKGYNNVNTLLFTSSNLTVGDGQPVMVSVEVAPDGSNTGFTLAAIIPGATSLIGSIKTDQTSSTIGNVSEIVVAPNADITKTAIGHISVQYALIPLVNVSDSLNGHVSELSVDRFIRLANEQAMAAFPQYNETADHWGFETGTQSWVATNGAVTQTTNFATDGTHCLTLTANGAGQPFATSPVGTSGQPVNVGDIVSVGAEIDTPTALTKMFLGILWYTSAGAACAHPEDDTADTLMVANTATLFKLKATAPATAAFFAIKFGDHNTDANTTVMNIDNVRVTPRMGQQTTKEYKNFLKEIRTLDQGILKESKLGFGLGYNTRISLINQSPAVTLDYSLGQIAGTLTPVVDDLLTKNHLVVKRHRGSTVTVTLSNGQMSVQQPPIGVGSRSDAVVNVIAEADEQLAAMAGHLLGLGTVTDERYPQVTVDLTRAAVASMFSNIGGVDIGSFIKIINLPFWYPSTTAQQLVIGYTETLNAFKWTITWNCKPYSPFIIGVGSAPRRW
jgi:hypothetical protein